MKRGILTVEALRMRCTIHPATHCWLWTQAVSSNGGQPTIHTFDHGRGEKRVMPGTRAAWNIAFGEAPPAWAMVFRACCQRLCLNPAHLRLARSKAEIGQHIRRAGSLKGTALQARRANVAKAHAAAGIVLTDPSIVRAIRAAEPATTSTELAALHGLTVQTVSRIRRGESHRHLLQPAAQGAAA